MDDVNFDREIIDSSSLKSSSHPDFSLVQTLSRAGYL